MHAAHSDLFVFGERSKKRREKKKKLCLTTNKQNDKNEINGKKKSQ